MKLSTYTDLMHLAARDGKSLNEAIEQIEDLSQVVQTSGVRPAAFFRLLEAAWLLGCDELRAQTWAIRYTTASAVYDFMKTEDLGPAARDKGGKVWRKVRIDPKHLDAQTGRYQSGSCGCVDGTEFDKLVRFGLANLE